MGVLTLMRRVRLKTIRRAVTHAEGVRLWQYFSIGLFGIFLGLISFFVSLFMFGPLASMADGELAVRVLAGFCTAAVLALVFTGLATALYTMYLSKDLDLLLSLPIKERTIFAYKFWETLAGNSAFFLTLGVPALIAYGVASGASFLYYLVLPPVAVLLLMIPTGICVLLIMPLMRLIPANRARELVAALGGLLIAVFYLLWFRFGAGTASAPEPGAAGSTENALQAALDAPILNVPPGSWISETLTGISTLDPGRLFAGLIPFIALSVGMYVFSLAVSGWAYATGRGRATESGGQVRSTGWAAKLSAPLPQDIRAVVVKDLTSLPRDLRRLVNVVIPVVMGLAFGFFYFSGGGSVMQVPSQFMPYLTMAGFAAMASMSGPAQSVGGEGRSYWFIVASPISTRRLLAAKWISAVSIGTAATLLGMLVVSLVSGLYLPGLLAGTVAGIVLSAVLDLYTVGVAAMYPRFDWENPNQVVTTAGGFVMMVCLIGLATLGGIVVAIAFGLAMVLPVWLSAIIAGAVWTAAAAAIGYAVFSSGVAQLKHMDWRQ